MSATSVINDDIELGFYVSPTGITITGRTRQYDTYEQMLKDPNPSKFAWVFDASGDPTVETGAAFYVYKNDKWQKLYESEAMDNEAFGKPEGYDELVLSVDGLKERVEQLADSTVLNDHINNNNVHVTIDDKDRWNNKVDKEEGKGLSSNDFTNEYIDKITNIESEVSRLDQTKMNLEEGLDLHNRIGLAEQELSSVTQRQIVTEATVSSVITTVAETKTKVDNITETVNGFQNNINTLSLRIDNNSSIIGNVSETVEAHENRFVEIHNEIENVSGTVYHQGLNIDQNKTTLLSQAFDISNLNSSVNKNSEDIEGLTQSQSEIESDLNSLQQSVSTNTQDIADLNTWKENLSIPESKDYDAEITELKETDAALHNNITSLENTIYSNIERLTVLEETVLGASTTISEIEEMVE